VQNVCECRVIGAWPHCIIGARPDCIIGAGRIPSSEQVRIA
jgi:hypothetical protein